MWEWASNDGGGEPTVAWSFRQSHLIVAANRTGASPHADEAARTRVPRRPGRRRAGIASHPLAIASVPSSMVTVSVSARAAPRSGGPLTRKRPRTRHMRRERGGDEHDGDHVPGIADPTSSPVVLSVPAPPPAHRSAAPPSPGRGSRRPCARYNNIMNPIPESEGALRCCLGACTLRAPSMATTLVPRWIVHPRLQTSCPGEPGVSTTRIAGSLGRKASGSGLAPKCC